MISQQTIQQIQARADILEIVGAFVKLKRRGSNYLGLCPFHNEKTPSFIVSPSKEIYKCFGCGKSGTSIGFLMEHEKYSYVEALRWLANKYNIEIEETEVSPEQKLQQEAADSLYIINNFAQAFFEKQLFESAEGTDIALSYLKERGFREDIIKKFRLGYNPAGGTAFATAATEAQYNPDLLLKSGLVVSRDNRLADNYRERIIFPIHNQSGKVLGFGARLIKKNDRAPKYINTPENEVYVKSRILYGLYFGRQAIDKFDECLLVEGYTDVVSLHQAGVENVVASGGTSLTPDQLRVIKKYTKNLTIIYDGDNAGVKAALRGLDLALEEGLNVRLVLIPDNEDPDSYVNKVGAAAFTEFVKNNKKDFIIFQLEHSLKEAGNDSVKKSALVNQVAETISKINRPEDFTLRADYIKQVSSILKIDEGGFHHLVNKFLREKAYKEQSKPDDTSPITEPVGEQPTGEEDVLLQLSSDIENEKAILRSLIEFGNMQWDEEKSVAAFITRHLIEDDLETMLEDPLHRNIFSLYKAWYDAGLNPTEKNFIYSDAEGLGSYVINLMDAKTDISPNWKEVYEGPIPVREQYFKEETLSTLTYLKLRKIKKMILQNQSFLEQKDLAPHDELTALQTHLELKAMERELLKAIGTVIIK